MLRDLPFEKLISKHCPWCLWEVTDFEPMHRIDEMNWHQDCWIIYLKQKPLEKGSL